MRTPAGNPGFAKNEPVEIKGGPPAVFLCKAYLYRRAVSQQIPRTLFIQTFYAINRVGFVGLNIAQGIFCIHPPVLI